MLLRRKKNKRTLLDSSNISCLLLTWHLLNRNRGHTQVHLCQQGSEATWLRLQVSRWNYWDLQEISSPPCEEPCFPLSTKSAHQVLFSHYTLRSSANVFVAKYTLCASRSRSSFFALVIGLFLISSWRTLCDKWMMWWDRSTPLRGC